MNEEASSTSSKLRHTGVAGLGLSVVWHLLTPAFTATHLNSGFSCICFLVTGAGLGHPDHCIMVVYFIMYRRYPITAFFWGLNGWYHILTHRDILINPTVLLCYLSVKNVKNSAGSHRQFPLCCKYLVSSVISWDNGLTGWQCWRPELQRKRGTRPHSLCKTQGQLQGQGPFLILAKPSDFYPVSLWGVAEPFWFVLFSHTVFYVNS